MGKKDTKNIITIDGPAGSGKSTVAKILARDLGLKYIDTGAMYRAVTLIALRKNIDIGDERAILRAAGEVRIDLESEAVDESSYTKISIDGEDVTDDIRSPQVGNAVSMVSRHPGVRKYLVDIQRRLASEGMAVLEGRDTGSVVCPDAILKVFLTAGIEERVRRRKLQLEQKNQKTDTSSVKKEITSRDSIDSSRKTSPLVVPRDGVTVDTSDMSIEEVARRIKDLYHDRTET